MLGEPAGPRGTRSFKLPALEVEHSFKLQALVKLTNTEPFAAWFVVTGDVTAHEIRVVRSVLGAISSLPIAPFGHA